MIATLSLKAKSNVDVDLKLNFNFNDQLIGSMLLKNEIQTFYYEFDDAPGDHRFEIELCGKRPEHTKINQHGEIIEDVFAEIFDVQISNINIDQVFYGQSIYFHDYNGNSKPVRTQFFRNIGCNGVIKFNFYTPAYLWLMDNL